MSRVELLGPTAWGPTCGSAVLKALPEHFRVTEVLDIELGGEGEHLWLHLLKRNLNTEDVARRLFVTGSGRQRPDLPQVAGMLRTLLGECTINAQRLFPSLGRDQGPADLAALRLVPGQGTLGDL